MIVSYFILLKCRLFINQGFKFTYHSRNKKPRLESIKLQSGYETHSLSSILNWLEDDWASIYSIFFDSTQFHAEYRMNEVVLTSIMLKNM